MNTLEKTALVIIIVLAIPACIMAWRGILEKDGDKLPPPFTQEELGTYPAKKPLEYPLESENFIISHPTTIIDGRQMAEPYILRRKSGGDSFYIFDPSDFEELYHLLKSKYE